MQVVTTSPTIQCLSVSKSYTLGKSPVVALRDLSLDITGPGATAIMGASGSGKSTLLNLLAGIDTPDEGTVTIAGNALHNMSERELTTFRRTQVGIVFQQFNLIPTMTARANVELPGVLDKRPSKWLRERSSELLERLGLADRMTHRPGAMSGGEQQRVAIARALLFQPAVLLADEPTGNLDSASSEKLWALLADIAKDHDMTVVMVTHEPAAAAHCERVVVIRDGCVAGELDTNDFQGEARAGDLAAHYQRLHG